MVTLRRFGRKLSLPSTRQIRHELRLVIAADERRKAEEAASAAPMEAIPDANVPPV